MLNVFNISSILLRIRLFLIRYIILIVFYCYFRVKFSFLTVASPVSSESDSHFDEDYRRQKTVFFINIKGCQCCYYHELTQKNKIWALHGPGLADG